MDRAAILAELVSLNERAKYLGELLAADDDQRHRQAAHRLGENPPCSWCGRPRARPELDRSWSLTGRYICCGQTPVGCPCRNARLLGVSPEEFRRKLDPGVQCGVGRG